MKNLRIIKDFLKGEALTDRELEYLDGLLEKYCPEWSGSRTPGYYDDKVRQAGRRIRVIRNLRSISSAYEVPQIEGLAYYLENIRPDGLEIVKSVAGDWIDADKSESETAAFQDVLSVIREAPGYFLDI